MFNFKHKNKIFDSVCVLSIAFAFSFLLFCWYRLYSTIPLGLSSEYFYRAWDLYDVYDKDGFLSYLNKVFFNFETLQPGIHPIITSTFLIILKGDWWWAILLHSICYMFLLVLFVYRFFKDVSNRYFACIFTVLLLLPFSLLRNFMFYNIEVGVLVFGVAASCYLLQDTNNLSFLKATVFLFLVALVRPIDGFILSSGLMLLYLLISVFEKKCSLREVGVYAVAFFVALWTFIIPQSFFATIYPLIILTLFFLSRKWIEKKIDFEFQYQLIPIAFVCLFCFFLGPVLSKLLRWTTAGTFLKDFQFASLFFDAVQIVFIAPEEQLNLAFLGGLSVFSLLLNRGRLYLLKRHLFLIVPLFFSVLGAIVIRNSAFHYHILGFFLLSVFCVSLILFFQSLVLRFLISLIACVLIFFHLPNYYSKEFKRIDFWRVFNQRGLIAESGCFAKSYPDSAVIFLNKLKVVDEGFVASSLHLDPSTSKDNLYFDMFRIKTLARMNNLPFDALIFSQNSSIKVGDLYLTNNYVSASSHLKYLDSFLVFSSSCTQMQKLFLYKVI